MAYDATARVLPLHRSEGGRVELAPSSVLLASGVFPLPLSAFALAHKNNLLVVTPYVVLVGGGEHNSGAIKIIFAPAIIVGRKKGDSRDPRGHRFSVLG